MYNNSYQTQYNPYQPQYNPQSDFYRQQMQQISQPMPQISQPMPQQQPQNSLTARAVTSIDEAKAAMIDPFGIFLFTDFANNQIYVKRINNNGLAEFYIFKAQNETQVDPQAEIKERLERIENILIGGIANVSTDVTTNATAEPTSVQSSNANDGGKKSGTGERNGPQSSQTARR